MLFGEISSMRAVRAAWTQRQSRALAAGLVLAGLVVSASAGPDPASAAAAAASQAGMKQLHYRGYTFEVPRSWAVIREARHPDSCVRFDEHVIYLGTPGSNQSCPSWLFGTTEALIIEPGPASAGRTSVENPVSREITVTAPRISITATFDANPNVLYTILAGAGLPAPQIQPPNPAILDVAEGKAAPVITTPAQVVAAASTAPPAALPSATTASATTASAAMTASATAPVAATAETESENLAPAAAVPVLSPELPSRIANFHGMGFDSCAAPSSAAMAAWKKHSPYGAVGIYVGGSDRACGQGNLTAAWVRREASAGWRFFPMYAGPQAAFGELKAPARQGTKAAADAVTQAQKLGFGRRTPLYYDMESYPAKTTGVALRFLSAWTTALHRLGYRSGVYSSSSSGVADLAQQYSKKRYVMPDTIFDALWNGSANVRDKVYKAKSWPLDHRMHQYSGNDTQTFGGFKIDVDKDFLDIGLAIPGGTIQPAPAVQSSSVFYEGSDHHLWRKPRMADGTWGTAIDMGGELSSPPSVVTVDTSTTEVFYRGRSGDLWLVKRTGSGWQRGTDISLMGELGTGPQAVAQPDGVVDVFWKGSHDDHLWHGQYDPGRGWSGPQRLGGDLASAPAPVENKNGGIQVLWEGTGPSRALWHVSRHLGGSWTKPASLGMGPLGGPPRATALPSGAAQVVWRGSTAPHHVWSAFLVPGRRAAGPRDLGGSVSGTPWPEAAGGTVRVFFRGTDSRMWQLTYRTDGRWHPPARLALGKLGSAPFGAGGTGSGPFEVFWQGTGGALWAASDAGHWTGAQRLGGRLR
jgi:glycoside hydrolase-like protein